MVIGTAYDILSWCGTPRFVYNDLPLGNPMGKPYDTKMHLETARQALALVENADQPGSIYESQFVWSQSPAWKDNYGRVDEHNRAELIEMGKQNRQRRRDNKAHGLFRE